MKDTHPSVEEKFFMMMMGNTGEERLKMGFGMYEMARSIVYASIDAPDDSEGFLMKVFNRFYENDLPLSFKLKFLEKLKERTAKA